jgi:hypothetical protein
MIYDLVLAVVVTVSLLGMLIPVVCGVRTKSRD